MTTYNRWEIWDADVPFDDGSGSKRRPVLILSDDIAVVLTLKMTSHAPRYDKLLGEYEIAKWEEAGLSKPTVIQCSNAIRLDKKRMGTKKYGTLSATDINGMAVMLKFMGIK